MVKHEFSPFIWSEFWFILQARVQRAGADFAAGWVAPTQPLPASTALTSHLNHTSRPLRATARPSSPQLLKHQRQRWISGEGQLLKQKRRRIHDEIIVMGREGFQGKTEFNLWPGTGKLADRVYQSVKFPARSIWRGGRNLLLLAWSELNVRGLEEESVQISNGLNSCVYPFMFLCLTNWPYLHVRFPCSSLFSQKHKLSPDHVTSHLSRDFYLHHLNNSGS